MSTWHNTRAMITLMVMAQPDKRLVNYPIFINVEDVLAMERERTAYDLKLDIVLSV